MILRLVHGNSVCSLGLYMETVFLRLVHGNWMKKRKRGCSSKIFHVKSEGNTMNVSSEQKLN